VHNNYKLLLFNPKN